MTADKWEKEALKFAKECISDAAHPTNIHGAVSGYVIGIKDYKSALRKAIGERKAHLREQVKIHPIGTDTWAANENRLRELQIFEGFLDTVEPE
jgi:hypothetical protein